MASLSGLKSATFDSLFIRGNDGTFEIRDLIGAGSGSSALTDGYFLSLFQEGSTQNDRLTENEAAIAAHTSSIASLSTALDGHALSLYDATAVQALLIDANTATTAAHTASLASLSTALDGHALSLYDATAVQALLIDANTATTAAHTTSIASLSTALDGHALSLYDATAAQALLIDANTATTASHTASLASLSTALDGHALSLYDATAAQALLIDANTAAVASHTASIATLDGYAVSLFDQGGVQAALINTSTAAVNTLNTNMASTQAALLSVTNQMDTTTTSINNMQSQVTSVSNTAQSAIATAVSALNASAAILSTDSDGNLSISGDILSSGKIKSDDDVISATGTLGRYLYSDAGQMCLHHWLLPSVSQSTYSMLVDTLGNMRINVPALRELSFRVADVEVGLFKSGGEFACLHDAVFSDAKIGSVGTSNAYFGHQMLLDTTNYAISQTSSGSTSLNASTGETVSIKISNTLKASFSTSGLDVNGFVKSGPSQIGLLSG